MNDAHSTLVADTKPTSTDTAPTPVSQVRPVVPRRRRYGSWIIVGLALLGVGGASYYWIHGRHRELRAGQAAEGRPDDPRDAGILVEAEKPHPGGIVRTTDAPGSVHAFEYADLFSKVSGYLKTQTVDLGDLVKVNQVLAEIDDPEILKAVDQARAALEQAKAKVGIAEARIKAAEAEVKSAEALVTQAEVGVKTQEANVSLRTKQLRRIQGLVERQAVEEKLQDEELDKFESAKSSENYAKAAVLSSRAQEASKRADVDQARADLADAKANVDVATANLGKAEVMAAYTKIVSPYDGHVTRRTYHRGDFVRSAAEGGAIPMLSVARLDLMRVILPVPDVDVPFVDRGDEATLRIAALPGEEFKGVVARFAETEDPGSRNMRTEVDLPNPKGRLKEGMYGKVILTLQKANPDSVTVPSSALVDKDSNGAGSVYLARDGKAHKVGVRVGTDTGVQVEVVEGLKPDDLVITRYNGTIAEGTPVVVQETPQPKAGH